MLLHEEESVVGAYEKQTPLSQVGDLLVFDYLLIHRSGFNNSAYARWSMQMRYFNFRDPVGRKNQWKGSFAAGVGLDTVHPELVVK
jgi:ectoine hydroxylase-related dioxygenase (phytanoyl-CoA dioxygenase family)